jgi:hypothetical protein
MANATTNKPPNLNTPTQNVNTSPTRQNNFGNSPRNANRNKTNAPGQNINNFLKNNTAGQGPGINTKKNNTFLLNNNKPTNQPGNKPGNTLDKTNNKLTNNNIDKLLANISKNNDKDKNVDNNSKNKNKEDNQGFLNKAKDSIGDTLTNIKNSIMSNKNTKENARENDRQNERKNNVNKIKENIAESNENAKNGINDKTIESYTGGESIWMILLKILLVVVILLLLYYVGKWLITKYLTASIGSPYLLNTTKNGKNAMVISQDPASVNYIPINKSEEQDGIQFTYGFWFLLENYDYKKGEWKHVFHKGNSSSYPNRAPGVWFHPDKNAIRVYMNTMDNILEYADIENIPVRKWVYMNIILNNRNLDLYINGYLKVRKELTSIPKQNNDDFWINMYGGFEGYLSNIRYYPYVIDFNEIYSNIKTGPSGAKCIDTDEIPPYLDDDWWFNYNG